MTMQLQAAFLQSKLINAMNQKKMTLDKKQAITEEDIGAKQEILMRNLNLRTSLMISLPCLAAITEIASAFMS